MSGDGTSAEPVVQIITDTGAATLTNTGTIAPASSSASGLAISESGGAITIYNTGTITGEVALANSVFNNESGGTWNVSGANTFGSGSNTINNAGTINVWANANGITTTIGAALDNTGSVDVQAGELDFSTAVTGTGSFTIANGAILEFGGSVAVGGIVSFAGSSGTLILGQPSSFDDQINDLAVGDTIGLLLPTGVTVTSAVINGSVLDVTESNGNQLSYNIAAASGSFSNDYFAIQNNANGSNLVLTAAAADTWNNSSGGDWSDAGDWSDGVPAANGYADIGVGGSYTVTVSTDVTVGGLSTIGTVTLDITTGALSISGAATSDLAGPVDNSGDLQLQDGAAVTVAGNLTNSGGLYVDNGGSGGSNLTIDGTLTNSNYIQIGDGSVAATVSAAGLSRHRADRHSGRHHQSGAVEGRRGGALELDRHSHSQRQWAAGVWWDERDQRDRQRG